MSPLIKVCGMTEAENIRNVELQGVDMIGFIFYPKSPRCLCQMPGYLPACAKRVGVFVNESKENILMYTDRFSLDYIQLHGNEAPSTAVPCTMQACTSSRLSPSCCPRTCFPSLPTTVCATTTSSTPRPRSTAVPATSSTGTSCTATTVPPVPAQRWHQPLQRKSPPGVPPPYFAGIDINSRFETVPGIKDVERITNFLKELKGGTI